MNVEKIKSSDDVVHVTLGGKWRMPTSAEWRELRENCIWTWTTQNGVSGYLVTSNKSGYASKSIFLPAAGYREYGSLYGAGSSGYYWSSSLRTHYPCSALGLYFGSEYFGEDGDYRFYGKSVRPVTD